MSANSDATPGPAPAWDDPDETTDEVDKIFGKSGPHMYCGKITKVGKDYFWSQH